jgi:hypothetical protein
MRMEPLYPGLTSDAFSIGVGKTIGDLQLDFGLEYLTGKREDLFYGILDGGSRTFNMKTVIPSVSVQHKF